MTDIDEKLLAGLIDAARELLERVTKAHEPEEEID
jgi:hypothetical protein